MSESRPPQNEWVKIRDSVLERDGRECQQCGKPESEALSLHVHHKLPVSEGGTHDLSNLITMCESCHFELHADERRNGTLEDIKDIFIKAHVPAFRSGEIGRLLGNYSGQASTKLQKLVELGFLETNGDGIYYKADLEVEDTDIVNQNDVIVNGSLIEFGEYIGDEELILQCEDCGRFVYSKRPERKLDAHQRNYCSGA